MTPLQKYVKDLGPKEFARRHGIEYRTALAYSGGARRPGPDVARKLVAESPLTWDDIYHPLPQKKKQS